MSAAVATASAMASVRLLMGRSAHTMMLPSESGALSPRAMRVRLEEGYLKATESLDEWVAAKEMDEVARLREQRAALGEHTDFASEYIAAGTRHDAPPSNEPKPDAAPDERAHDAPHEAAAAPVDGGGGGGEGDGSGEGGGGDGGAAAWTHSISSGEWRKVPEVADEWELVPSLHEFASEAKTRRKKRPAELQRTSRRSLDALPPPDHPLAEQPAEEQPAEEQPAEEWPVEGQPVADEPQAAIPADEARREEDETPISPEHPHTQPLVDDDLSAGRASMAGEERSERAGACACAGGALVTSPTSPAPAPSALTPPSISAGATAEKADATSAEDGISAAEDVSVAATHELATTQDGFPQSRIPEAAFRKTDSGKWIPESRIPEKPNSRISGKCEKLADSNSNFTVRR